MPVTALPRDIIVPGSSRAALPLVRLRNDSTRPSDGGSPPRHQERKHGFAHASILVSAGCCGGVCRTLSYCSSRNRSLFLPRLLVACLRLVQQVFDPGQCAGEYLRRWRAEVFGAGQQAQQVTGGVLVGDGFVEALEGGHGVLSLDDERLPPVLPADFLSRSGRQTRLPSGSRDTLGGRWRAGKESEGHEVEGGSPDGREALVLRGLEARQDERAYGIGHGFSVSPGCRLKAIGG